MKEITRKNVAGIWSATPTPFTEKLELDNKAVSRLVEHHVQLGIKGLFLSSIIGEGLIMSDSMKLDLAAEVVKSNQDRMLLSMLIVSESCLEKIINKLLRSVIFNVFRRICFKKLTDNSHCFSYIVVICRNNLAT